MSDKYRIRQGKDGYHIEVMKDVTKCKWSWRKFTYVDVKLGTSYYAVNTKMYRYRSYINIGHRILDTSEIELKPFNTLSEAQNHIKQHIYDSNKYPIYHKA